MLVTSIFYFSHNVFCPSQTNFKFSITFILSFVNAFNLDQSKILLFGKELRMVGEYQPRLQSDLDLHHFQKQRCCAWSPYICQLVSKRRRKEAYPHMVNRSLMGAIFQPNKKQNTKNGSNFYSSLKKSYQCGILPSYNVWPFNTLFRSKRWKHWCGIVKGADERDKFFENINNQ